MFLKASKEKLRGSGMVILNAIRAFNILALLSVAAASWVMIVMSGVTLKFSFFDFMSHFFAFLVTTFLIVSECGILRGYFFSAWPVFADEHGFFWLGVSMIVLGCGVMSDLSKPVNFTDNLGMPLWRFIVAAGILSITGGFFNIIANFVFQDRKEGITARQVRTNGSLARPRENSEDYYSSHSGTGVSVRKGEKDDGFSAPKNWAKRATALFAKKKLEISKPIPHDRDDDLERGDDSESWAEDRRSPIDSKTPRPPSAAHPAHHAYGEGSRYSVANMTHF